MSKQIDEHAERGGAAKTDKIQWITDCRKSYQTWRETRMYFACKGATFLGGHFPLNVAGVLAILSLRVSRPENRVAARLEPVPTFCWAIPD
jgi:hypothetical protein